MASKGLFDSIINIFRGKVPMDNPHIILATQATYFIEYEEHNKYEFICLVDKQKLLTNYSDVSSTTSTELTLDILDEYMKYCGASCVTELVGAPTHGNDMMSDVRRRNILVSVCFPTTGHLNHFKVAKYDLYFSWKCTARYLIEDVD